MLYALFCNLSRGGEQYFGPFELNLLQSFLGLIFSCTINMRVQSYCEYRKRKKLQITLKSLFSVTSILLLSFPFQRYNPSQFWRAFLAMVIFYTFSLSPLIPPHLTVVTAVIESQNPKNILQIFWSSFLWYRCRNRSNAWSQVTLITLALVFVTLSQCALLIYVTLFNTM